MATSNLQCVTFFLVCIIGLTLSIPHHTPDHSNHCHAEGGDSGVLHIEVGHSASLPGKCVQVTCQKDFTLSEITCPALKLAEGCKLSDTDYSKSYPECCPQADCYKKN